MYNRNTQTKVAFVLWTLEGMGGSERVVYDLARKLDRTAFKVIIIGFSDGPIRRLYEEMGVPIFALSKKKKSKLGLVRDIRRILIQEQVDLVNPHHFGPFLYASLARAGLGTKMIYTEHSQWQLEELTLVEKAINRILLAKADAIIAISGQIRDYYLKKLFLKPQKVHLISNGIDLEFIAGGDGIGLRRSFGIKQQERVIGIVANLRPEKNHRLLLSAFSQMTKERDGIRLLIVGADCMEGEVQRFAGQTGVGDKILFLGRRDDIRDLLSIIDVFCLPSIHEGLPLTILEAMAAGVPVVGSDVMGINEVITHGSNGLLFPAGNEEKLAETLTQIITDESMRDRLSSVGRDFVGHNYALNDKVNQYERLFSWLCSPSALPR
jgi:L-malate glycosyltransferase